MAFALRAVIAWLVILVLAVLNGLLREAVLLPNLSRPAAFALSALLLSSFVLIVAIVLARWLELTSSRRGVTVGCLWLGLTLLFEFGFGRIVEGRSWSELWAAYTFEDGNLWPLVLVVTFLAPPVAARVRGRERGVVRR